MPINAKNRQLPKSPTSPNRWHDSFMATMGTSPGNGTGGEINVGKKLREFREKKGLSIRTLAEMSGLNFNTLSLIENGRSSPSVSTLQFLAAALGVHISAFFENPGQPREIVIQKEGNRPKANFANGVLEDLGSGLMLGDGVPLLINLNKEADSGNDNISHTGQEFIYCLEGRLYYTVAGQVYVLDKGDSLIFEAHLPHRWENREKEPARFLLILCPSDEKDMSARRHFLMSSEPTTMDPGRKNQV